MNHEAYEEIRKMHKAVFNLRSLQNYFAEKKPESIMDDELTKYAETTSNIKPQTSNGIY